MQLPHITFADCARDLRALADERERDAKAAHSAMLRIGAIAARRYFALADLGTPGFIRRGDTYPCFFNDGGDPLRMLTAEEIDESDRPDALWYQQWRSIATVEAHRADGKLGTPATLAAHELASVEGGEHSKTSTFTYNPARWRDAARDYATLCEHLHRVEEASKAKRPARGTFASIAHNLRALADEPERTASNAASRLRHLGGMAARLYGEHAKARTPGFEPRLGRIADPDGLNAHVHWSMAWRAIVAHLAATHPDRLGHIATIGASHIVEARQTGGVKHLQTERDPAAWRDDARDWATACDILAELEPADDAAVEPEAATKAAAVGDDFPLCDEDLTILCQIHGQRRLVQATQLLVCSGMPKRSKLYSRLKAMEETTPPLIERPKWKQDANGDGKGKRSGYRVTQHGVDALRRCGLLDDAEC